MEEWRLLGQKVRTLINPSTFLVAVKFLGEESLIPPSAKRPLKDLNVRMAPCQGAGMTRRYGWTVAFGKEDVGCAIAAHTYGWEKANQQAAIKFLTEMNYARDEAAAHEVMNGFRLLERGEDPPEGHTLSHTNIPALHP
ncbi:MAG: DUF169 domain-containing protein [Pseudomonadota bacterium]